MSDTRQRQGTLARPVRVVKESPAVVLEGRLAGPGPFPGVYAKLHGEPKRSIEFVCAWLGRALELPIPEPALVTVHAQKMPHGFRWPFSEDTAQVFGSLAVEGALPISKAALDRHEIDQTLRGWEFIERAAVFDHLIANDDRSEGNVLLAPNRRLHLIDHARSLGGGGDRLFSSEYFPAVEGLWLKLLKGMPLSERISRRSRLISACVAASSLVPLIPYAMLSVPEDIQLQVASYLGKRADALLPMVMNAVGLPDLSVSAHEAARLQ